MVQQPVALISSSSCGRPASRPPAGFDQSNLDIRPQLLEPANQAATGQPCTDNGEIYFSHVR